jgi:hypothetical protein
LAAAATCKIKYRNEDNKNNMQKIKNIGLLAVVIRINNFVEKYFGL